MTMLEKMAAAMSEAFWLTSYVVVAMCYCTWLIVGAIDRYANAISRLASAAQRAEINNAREAAQKARTRFPG